MPSAAANTSHRIGGNSAPVSRSVKWATTASPQGSKWRPVPKANGRITEASPNCPKRQQLQVPTVYGDLGPAIARSEAARLLPDLLTVFREVQQSIDFNAHTPQIGKKPQISELAHRVRQEIDPDAKRPGFRYCLIDGAAKTRRMQAQCGRESRYASAYNCNLHPQSLYRVAACMHTYTPPVPCSYL